MHASRSHRQTHTHAHINMHTHIRINTHTHTLTHARARTHACTHAHLSTNPPNPHHAGLPCDERGGRPGHEAHAADPARGGAGRVHGAQGEDAQGALAVVVPAGLTPPACPLARQAGAGHPPSPPLCVCCVCCVCVFCVCVCCVCVWACKCVCACAPSRVVSRWPSCGACPCGACPRHHPPCTAALAPAALRTRQVRHPRACAHVPCPPRALGLHTRCPPPLSPPFSALVPALPSSSPEAGPHLLAHTSSSATHISSSSSIHVTSSSFLPCSLRRRPSGTRQSRRWRA